MSARKRASLAVITRCIQCARRNNSGPSEEEIRFKRDAIIHLIALREIAINDEDRTRILTCSEITELDQWFDNAVNAKTIAEVLS